MHEPRRRRADAAAGCACDAGWGGPLCQTDACATVDCGRHGACGPPPPLLPMLPPPIVLLLLWSLLESIILRHTKAR
eukprot:SAG11_NODE_10079_length_857_cov_1.899736_2_plen_77_part_00